MHPDFRTALKRAHPGLTDAIIDRYEELTSQQFALDSVRHAKRFAELDRERQKLLHDHMPCYRQIWEEFQDSRSGPARG